MSSVITISSADELPFGLLSNHFKYPFRINNQEWIWDSVSQYIYVNLIPYEYDSYRQQLLSVKNHKLLYTNFMNFSNIIYHETIIKLLEECLEKKFSIPKYRDFLLKTGNMKLIYNNPADEFLGTKSINHYMFGCIPDIGFKYSERDSVEDNSLLNNDSILLPLKIEEIKSKFQSEIPKKEENNMLGQTFENVRSTQSSFLSKKDKTIINTEETNMLGKLLENIRFKLRKQYEEDILYKPFLVLMILENVCRQEDHVVLDKYISIITGKKSDEISFDEIIKTYGEDKIKSKLPVDYVSLYRENDYHIINKDGYTCYGCGLRTESSKSLLNHQELCFDKKRVDLNKILKCSFDDPVLLVKYFLKSEINGTSRIRQLYNIHNSKMENIIFDKYITNLISKTKQNISEDQKIELINSLNHFKIKNIIISVSQLYYDGLLDEDLTDDITEGISLITGSSVTLEYVNFFENLDINKECKDKNYNDNENDFYIFDDSDDSILSIHTKIDGTKIDEYDTIFDYITETIKKKYSFLPQIKGEEYINKKKSYLHEAIKSKFKWNGADYFNPDENTYSLLHILSICKNNDILFIDKDQDIGIEYIDKIKYGKNWLGNYLSDLSKKLNINFKRSINNIAHFIENDLFMRRWLTLQTQYTCSIIFNIISYLTLVQNKHMTVDIKYINKILNVFYNKNLDEKVDENLILPNFFVELIRVHGNKFQNFNFNEINVILKLIWKHIIHNILLLNSNDENDIKIAIYKLQIILSSKYECFSDVIISSQDDCILRSIFYINDKLSNFDIIKDDKLKIKCIEGILLRKEKEIYKENILNDEHSNKDQFNEEEFNEEQYNKEMEEKILKPYHKENRKNNKEKKDYDSDIFDEDNDDEDNDEEDGSSYRLFTKYKSLTDGNCFFSSIFRSLRDTPKLLDKFVKCLKDKYDEKIKINDEKSFIRDIRVFISEKIDLNSFFESINELAKEDKYLHEIINELKKTKDDKEFEKIKEKIELEDEKSEDLNKEKLIELLNKKKHMNVYIKGFSKDIKKIIEKYFGNEKIDDDKIDDDKRDDDIKENFVKEIKGVIETMNSWVTSEIEVDFMKKLFSDCDIIMQIKKDVNQFKINEYEVSNTIYLINESESHYVYALNTTNKETNRETNKETNRETNRETNKETKNYFNRNKIPYNIDDILSVVVYDEKEEDLNKKYKISKRSLTILSEYLKKNNITIDPEMLLHIINTVNNHVLPAKVKRSRYNYYNLQNDTHTDYNIFKRKLNPHCEQTYINGPEWEYKGSLTNIPFNRILELDAPRLEYKKRGDNYQRTVIHHGQRKLLMSEIEFFNLYTEPNVEQIVVYAGAAPGTHITLLSELFPNVKFYLYDPAPFNQKLYSYKYKKNIIINQTFFTDKVAEQFKDTNCLFVCDMRRADEERLNSEQNDMQIRKDMEDQMLWHEIMNPKASMLKFRLSWEKGITNYLDGKIYLPVWGRATTTESRLIVEGNDRKDYDNTEYEEQMFYFNSVTRVAKYNHDIIMKGIDHCYDCSSEIHIWKEYLNKRNQYENSLNKEIIKKIKEAESCLGRKLSGGNIERKKLRENIKKKQFVNGIPAFEKDNNGEDEDNKGEDDENDEEMNEHDDEEMNEDDDEEMNENDDKRKMNVNDYVSIEKGEYKGSTGKILKIKNNNILVIVNKKIIEINKNNVIMKDDEDKETNKEDDEETNEETNKDEEMNKEDEETNEETNKDEEKMTLNNYVFIKEGECKGCYGRIMTIKNNELIVSVKNCKKKITKINKKNVRLSSKEEYEKKN